MNIKRAFLAAVAALMVPGFVMAQSTVTFTSIISDAAGGTPELTRTCNGGLPLTQSGPLGTTLTVTDINLGDECNVDLTGDLNAGYEVDFFVCGPSGLPTQTGCHFIMVDGTDSFEVQVWVKESPADFYVNVTWEISDDADPGVGVGTMVDIVCDSTSTSHPAGPDDTIPAPAVADVAPGESCQASLSGYDSAVSVSPDVCVAMFSVNGGDQTCDFTATAFFEGIPTLSQYGMAIMVLLMLGVGFVGFRRFV